MPTALLPVPDFAPPHPNGHYTYADYLTWDYPPYVELIEGWATVRPTPWTRHQQCLSRLVGEIGSFVKSRPQDELRAYMGPLDVRLLATQGDDHGTTTVVLPDFFVAKTAEQVDELGCVGAPAWIIEIVSPGTLTRDTQVKYDLYARSGVAEYWLVFPGERTVSVFLLENGTYRSGGDFYEPGRIPSHTLPALHLEWADVFAGV